MNDQMRKMEDGGRKTEGRSQRSEDGGRRAEGDLRSTICVLLSALVLTSGCTKSKPPEPATPAAPAPLTADTVLRAHWVGKHALGVAASAYSIMRLWELPESQRLQSQLLARLAGSVGGVMAGKGTTGPSAAWEPLMDSLVDQECFLEIRESTNQGTLVVVAIRLDAAQAKLWHVNLAGALSSITGQHPTTQATSWKLKDPRTGQMIELTREGNWTLVGFGPDMNPLREEIAARIRQQQSPGGWRDPKAWLEAEVNLEWAGQNLFPAVPPTPGAPHLSLTITGDGAHVLTRAVLDFPQPLALKLEPWSFPKNQILSPVIGFSAVRGLGPWLGSTKAWAGLELGPAPNQFFTWAEAAAPLQMHLAARPETTDRLPTASADWIARGNEWLAKNGVGTLAPLPSSAGLVWQGLPVIRPFIKAIGTGTDSQLVGGLVENPTPATNPPPAIYPRPSPDQLIGDIESRSNLVAYAWETTGARAESFYLLSQVLRVSRLHPQLPADAITTVWMQAVRQRLGNATTTVTLTAPDQLTCERKSAVGFTAAELHLLGDWLESPDFPRGLYSTRTPRAASAAAMGAQP